MQEHPEWFRHRPDGTIQYAENPPKKYQDIYPFDFESDDWQALWDELLERVPLLDRRTASASSASTTRTPSRSPFWEWLIAEVKREHPDVIFLAEAFTRPKVMYRLAKVGSPSRTPTSPGATRAES